MNKAKKKAPAKNRSKKQASDIKPGFNENKPILSISLKVLGLAIMVALAIIYSDRKGYFDPDQTNNHTKKKWDGFYTLSEKEDIDILLVGNSHLYTGINPKNLSVEMGATAFILASPGTYVGDMYYSLKEALKKCNPSVVVIETYGIKAFEPHNLSGGELSDQLKSFSARKDVLTKLASTPALFTSNNYLPAWSNTIRNHDFLYTNRERLEKNKELIQDKDDNTVTGLYLGRYARFQTGIKENILKKYDEEGSPVNGEDYSINKYTKEYTDLIVALCKKKDIPLVFLTLPMYHKHIENYDVWKERLAGLLEKYKLPWYDMQDPYDYDAFTKHCFESTYSSNQHMTYPGSMIASYKFSDFLRKEGIEFPDNADRAWHTLFYGEEGYFFNYSPIEADKNNKVIAEDLKFGSYKIDELSILDLNEEHPKIQVKMDRSLLQTTDLKRSQLQLLVEYKVNDNLARGVLQVPYDRFHIPAKYAIFSVNLQKNVEILRIGDARLVL